METYRKKIFYASVACHTYPEKGKNPKREGLSLKKLEREFPYLLGENRRNPPKLQIYFSLLPEYAGKSLFGKKPKEWKRETVRKLLVRAGQKAYEQGCRDQILSEAFGTYEEKVPMELWAAWLYQKRPFESMCISMGAEDTEQNLQELIELIGPYLPRMKSVVFQGLNSRLSEQLEDYLYEEFGIVMTNRESRKENMVTISSDPSEIRAETVKFLDTIVKNGYNTEVD